MSAALPIWGVGSEKQFINGIGNFSNQGKIAGRKACLRGYIKALETLPSCKLGFSRNQIADLLGYAREALSLCA